MTIDIPKLLEIEFEAVSTLLDSQCKTKTVDALILCLVKYEKQLRRLYFFLALEFSNLSGDEIVNAIQEDRHLYAGNFMEGIKLLSGCEISNIVGDKFKSLIDRMIKVECYRNKLVHGQLTGKSLDSSALEILVKDVINWVDALAAGAKAKFNFDGVDKDYPKRKSEIDKKAIKLENLTALKEQLKEIGKPKYKRLDNFR